VKALREGRGNMKDSYAQVKNGEVFVYDMHISPYSHGNSSNHISLRVRKLLLHKREIKKLYGKSNERGLGTYSPEDVFQKRKSEGRDRDWKGQEAV